jgi:hypothetical protein
MRQTKTWTIVLTLSVVSVCLSSCDPLSRILLNPDDIGSQGIFGIVMVYPGACLTDPENPGECLNKPFPGYGEYDIRRYEDSLDNGFSNPVLMSFVSRSDGLLFSIDARFQGDLDNGVISEALRRELGDNGVNARDATVSLVQPDRMWQIINEQRRDIHTVAKAEGKLDVYHDGWFRVALPEGKYCVWWENVCQQVVEIEAGKWLYITLGVFLP